MSVSDPQSSQEHNTWRDEAMQRKLQALHELETIVERLRGPDGCPWDRKQTLVSLSSNFLEEACEVIDAIGEGQSLQAAGNSGSSAGANLNASPEICEELGDLLMNIFLASRVAEEAGGFSLTEVARGIGKKLIRRHPHVFGGEKIEEVSGVLSRWNALKAQEKTRKQSSGLEALAEPSSVLDGIPKSLPTLAAAFELGLKAAKIGFDWPSAREALDKVREELGEVESCFELHGARAEGSVEKRKLQDEIGDLIFAVVNVARMLEIAPDAALRRAMDKFRRRFQHIEIRVRESPAQERPTLKEMERLWQQAKTLE